MSARQKFIDECLSHVGETVLMGALDCSELVALGVKAAGGPDQTKTHTAQRYHDETRRLLPGETPIPGDLVFYGVPQTKAANDGRWIQHVAIALEHGYVLSADGATAAVKDLDTARKRGARVRIHDSVHYRRDLPLVVVHRNTVVDSIDFVTL